MKKLGKKTTQFSAGGGVQAYVCVANNGSNCTYPNVCEKYDGEYKWADSNVNSQPVVYQK